MKYGDFSSLVQLGVGLHVGTALLQIYGEIGVAPLERRLARLRSLVEASESPGDQVAGELGDGVGEAPTEENATSSNGEVELTLSRLESDLVIFKVQFSQEYWWYTRVNAVVAGLLIIFLIVISYKFDDELPGFISIVFTFFSALPALMSLAMLWGGSERVLSPLRQRVEKLEDRAIGGGPSR